MTYRELVAGETSLEPEAGRALPAVVLWAVKLGVAAVLGTLAGGVNYASHVGSASRTSPRLPAPSLKGGVRRPKVKA